MAEEYDGPERRHSEYFTKIFERLDSHDVFRGRVEIAGVIALTIWAGSFWYTHNHKVDSINVHNKLESISDENTRDIATMKGDYKVVIVEIRNLTKEISSTNGNLRDLVEALAEGDKIQKVYLENYKHEKQ